MIKVLPAKVFSVIPVSLCDKDFPLGFLRVLRSLHLLVGSRENDSYELLVFLPDKGHTLKGFSVILRFLHPLVGLRLCVIKVFTKKIPARGGEYVLISSGFDRVPEPQLWQGS